MEEKAKTWAEVAESRILGLGFNVRSPEAETASSVDVRVVFSGMLALRRARREALRRAGRGESACL